MKKFYAVLTIFATMLTMAGCATSTPTPSESPSTTESTSGTGSVADNSEDGSDTTTTSSEATFDASSYCLDVEVADNAMFTVVSVYGNSPDAFSEMESIILDAAHAYGITEDDATVSTEFNSIIGTEGGSGKTWEDGGIITSAPNDTENFYRADLYIYK